MKMKLAVLVAAVAAAAFMLLSTSLDDSSSQPPPMTLEIREEGEDLGLIPVDGGAAGPESVAFDGRGDGPYTGVSDGRVLRWVPGERRWAEHSASAPEL
jgi:hypothetical protein